MLKNFAGFASRAIIVGMPLLMLAACGGADDVYYYEDEFNVPQQSAASQVTERDLAEVGS